MTTPSKVVQIVTTHRDGLSPAYEPVRLPVRAVATGGAGIVLVFFAAAVPVPMWPEIGPQVGVGSAGLSAAAATYFLGAVAALLVMGRLPDRWGRRPSGLLTIALGVLGCLLLIDVSQVWILLLSRVLQGMACGLGSSAFGAYVVDCSTNRAPWLPAAIVGSSPMIGLPGGAITSGMLVDHAPYPHALPFILAATLLALVALMLVWCPETVRDLRRSTTPSSRDPAMGPTGRRWTAVAAVAMIGTWPFGGLLQALGPTLSRDQLGTTSATAGALAFGAVMVINPLGGPAARRIPPQAGVIAGMLFYVTAQAAAVTALRLGSASLFLGLSTSCGFAQGVASASAMRLLIPHLQIHHRARTLSLLTISAFVANAVMVAITSVLVRSIDSADIAWLYVALAGASSLAATTLVLWNPLGRFSSS